MKNKEKSREIAWNFKKDTERSVFYVRWTMCILW